MNLRLQKVSLGGLLIAVGIIYGDIGTSPLYTFQTILRNGVPITPDLVLGALSCVFWTLTLQTTFKYVIITLQADNNGEGGVFSLYALVRPYARNLSIPAMLGAATLLADGIITPPISVTSAIEGLGGVRGLERIMVPGHTLVIQIVLLIILLLFTFQRYGTDIVGRSFGPVMVLWFVLLASLGAVQIVHFPAILKGLNPYYGYRLLIDHPRGFWLLGAIFLCTTGAEALYSDLGHCGRRNIQVSWVFVKTALVLNYFGQGAWVLAAHKTDLGAINPFFAIVPSWLLLPSVMLATAATIIASQALISGSFTLISEAIRLGFWPRVAVKHPTDIRGQIYIPSINWLLCGGCFAVVLYFQTSERMTAAYGFSITIAMLMTTLLMAYFLRYVKMYPVWLVTAIVGVFVVVETSFFVANAVKIVNRLAFIVVEVGLFGTMYIWWRGRQISSRYTPLTEVAPFSLALGDLSADTTIPKYATHLIYLTGSTNRGHVEKKILDSIFARQAKRADVYWFVHVEFTDEPLTTAYHVEVLAKDKVIRVDFRLGFRVQPRINFLLRKLVEEMGERQDLTNYSALHRLGESDIRDDFRFVVLEEFLSYENELPWRQEWLMSNYFNLKRMARSNLQAYGLDASDAVVEQVALIISPISQVKLEPF